MVGVGGQGILLASQIIGEAAIRQGEKVVMSEVHGMAQRGGVVTCSVRIGDATSPLIGNGEADIILGFEPVETYRALAKGHDGTWVITSTNPIIPFTVSSGNQTYPELEHVFEQMRGATDKLVLVDALQKAKDAGAEITANVVLIGALAGCKSFPFEMELMKKVVLDTVPVKFKDVNARAFELGADSCSF
ncbi:MAG TPA: indolepyruvate ferredoxin oxidoreductase subunit beta [Euryarchaeota archaeon]|nr:indolepyruvate ferredoxin oxidoreductase subunit beta [Euryarchaeota archaeon]